MVLGKIATKFGYAETSGASGRARSGARNGGN